MQRELAREAQNELNTARGEIDSARSGTGTGFDVSEMSRTKSTSWAASLVTVSGWRGIAPRLTTAAQRGS